MRCLTDALIESNCLSRRSLPLQLCTSEVHSAKFHSAALHLPEALVPGVAHCGTIYGAAVRLDSTKPPHHSRDAELQDVGLTKAIHYRCLPITWPGDAIAPPCLSPFGTRPTYQYCRLAAMPDATVDRGNLARPYTLQHWERPCFK